MLPTSPALLRYPTPRLPLLAFLSLSLHYQYLLCTYGIIMYTSVQSIEEHDTCTVQVQQGYRPCVVSCRTTTKLHIYPSDDPTSNLYFSHGTTGKSMQWRRCELEDLAIHALPSREDNVWTLGQLARPIKLRSVLLISPPTLNYYYGNNCSRIPAS